MGKFTGCRRKEITQYNTRAYLDAGLAENPTLKLTECEKVLVRFSVVMNNFAKYITDNENERDVDKKKAKKPDSFSFLSKVPKVFRKTVNKNEGRDYFKDVLNVKYSARVLNVFLFYISVVYAVIVYAWFIITNLTA